MMVEEQFLAGIQFRINLGQRQPRTVSHRGHAPGPHQKIFRVSEKSCVYLFILSSRIFEMI